MQIGTRPVYDPPSPQDGCRILVDGIWPRGSSKARAQLDDWRRNGAGLAVGAGGS